VLFYSKNLLILVLILRFLDYLNFSRKKLKICYKKLRIIYEITQGLRRVFVVKVNFAFQKILLNPKN